MNKSVRIQLNDIRSRKLKKGEKVAKKTEKSPPTSLHAQKQNVV